MMNNKVVYFNKLNIDRESMEYRFGIDNSNGFRITYYSPFWILLSKNSGCCKILYSRVSFNEQYTKVVVDSLNS